MELERRVNVKGGGGSVCVCVSVDHSFTHWLVLSGAVVHRWSLRGSSSTEHQDDERVFLFILLQFICFPI